MWKIFVIILILVLVWGLTPTRHKLEMQSCDFSFTAQHTVCGDWRVSYFWDYGWLIKMGNYEQPKP